MNYVRHLNAVLESLMLDVRILPRHISLYMALFHIWNKLMFVDPIHVARQELMPLSKIGSVNTFIKSMKELDEWGYIRYRPSKSTFQGSQITIITFDNTTDNSTGNTTGNSTDNTTSNSTGNSTGNATDNTINKLLNNNYKALINNKKTTNKTFREGAREQKEFFADPEKEEDNPKVDEGIKRRFRKPTLSQLEIFFQEKKIPATEAQRFFNHFESNGWKVGGKSPMKDWKAAGRNWILNISRYGPKTDMKENTNNYLSTSNNKDYGEPL